MTETCGAFWKEIRPMHRHSGLHARIPAAQFGAEIDAFFQVGHSGGQLTAHREIAPPSARALFHRNAHLLLLAEREERHALGLNPSDQLDGNAMAAHVEETVGAAGR